MTAWKKMTGTLPAVLLAAAMLLTGCGGNSEKTAGTAAAAGNSAAGEQTAASVSAEKSGAAREESSGAAETAAAASAPKEVSPSGAGAGDLLTFGAWEQDGDYDNGLEPVEWQVLETDGDKLLVVSRKILDCQPYDLNDEDASWETCSLRAWLNEDFYRSAFLAQEQEAVLLSDVPADKNPQEDTDPGNGTEDRVFLLSAAEVERFFPEEADQVCPRSEEAAALGVLGNEVTGGTWWLRTPGNGKSYASYVYPNGGMDLKGKKLDHDDFGIRPALRISASALETALQASGSSGQRMPESENGREPDLSSLQAAEAGSVVQLGVYEQDGDRENGPEPIEWVVLKKDGSRVLLLSKYVLETHLFSGGYSSASWSGSSLRAWLNHAFFRTAFTKAERDMIPMTSVQAQVNEKYPDVAPGEDTEDRVFLLSFQEVEELLPSREDRYGLSTDYGYARNERAGAEKGVKVLPWWLRSQGMSNTSVGIVKGNGGDINYKGTMPGSHNPMVRPALWIETGK